MTELGMREPLVPPAVDRVVLDRLVSEIGEGVVRELVGMYLRDAPESSEAISTALEAKDRGALTQVAHRLRSASRTLGATHLSEMLSVVEEIARARNELSVALPDLGQV